MPIFNCYSKPHLFIIDIDNIDGQGSYAARDGQVSYQAQDSRWQLEETS